MDTSAANGLTRKIARSVRGLSYESLAADVVFVAKQCALEWSGKAAFEGVPGVLVKRRSHRGDR